MLIRKIICIIGLFGLSACATTDTNCKYETQDVFAHVVSVPSQAIISMGIEYQNVKLDIAEFPESPKPAQVYKVQINKLVSGTCSPTVFKVIERVK